MTQNYSDGGLICTGSKDGKNAHMFFTNSTCMAHFLVPFIVNTAVYFSQNQKEFWKKAFLFTAQKIKLSMKEFFSKCDQIRRKQPIWSHLLKKFLMENFIFLCSDWKW